MDKFFYGVGGFDIFVYSLFGYEFFSFVGGMVKYGDGKVLIFYVEGKIFFYYC